MQMLTLTYVAQGGAVSRLGRVSSPATQLRFGTLLLRPGRSVQTPSTVLKNHIDLVCDAMARGILVVRSGPRRLDPAELKSIVVAGALPAPEAPRPTSGFLGNLSAPPPEEPPPAEEPPAEEPADAAAEAEEVTEPATPSDAPEPEPESAPAASSGGKRRRGR